MTNSADPDQLASSEANWSGYTVCKDRVYPGSAGQGLRSRPASWSANFNMGIYILRYVLQYSIIL